MEAYFDNTFKDIRHERPLMLLISLTDPDVIKRNKITYQEKDILKTLALEQLPRQRK